jgi:hypothetical protein
MSERGHTRCFNLAFRPSRMLPERLFAMLYNGEALVRFRFKRLTR